MQPFSLLPGVVFSAGAAAAEAAAGARRIGGTGEITPTNIRERQGLTRLLDWTGPPEPLGPELPRRCRFLQFQFRRRRPPQVSKWGGKVRYPPPWHGT